MSRNGSGTYTLPAGNPVVTGTTIASSWANTTLSDISSALTQSVASDGQTPMSGNLNMASNKIIALATPTATTDAVTKAYADALVAGGSAGVFTSVTDSGLTSGRVTYAGTAGLLQDSANLTFNGTTLTTTGISTSNNLTFTGTGNRITGDFSNATVANRVLFQSSTTNGLTNLGAIPNGTATDVAFNLINNSDPTNASRLALSINAATDARINSSINGTGTYLPLTMYTGGTEKFRIAADTTGTYTFGGTAPRITGDFSNATQSNRVAIQTSTTNGATTPILIPNGTGTTTGWLAFNNSDPTNASFAGLLSLSGATQLTSGITGTGTYQPLTMYTGGSERLRIDTSGNVGINASSSSVRLYVRANLTAGTSNSIRLLDDGTAATSTSNNSYGYGFNASTGELSTTAGNGGFHTWYTANTEKMRIFNSGDVSIGNTTAPGAKLEVNATSGYQLQLNDSSATGNGNKSVHLIAYKNGTGYHNIQYTAYNHLWNAGGAPAEAARIDSSGNFMVGGTTPQAKVTFVGVGGNNSWVQANVNAGTAAVASIVFQNDNGTVGSINTSGSSTAYITSSDYRLKENIAPMTGALSVVQKLKPVTYNWKTDGSASQGFIAHELQSVVPECVIGEKDAVDAEGNPVYQGIDTSFLVATLTAAIQELNAKVTALEAQLAVK